LRRGTYNGSHQFDERRLGLFYYINKYGNTKSEYLAIKAYFLSS